VKRVLVVFFFVLGLWPCVRHASAQTSTPIPEKRPSGRVAFVTRITPSAAPSGAVVQLSIQSPVSDPKVLTDKYRLTIGGATTQFYLIDDRDKDTIAAVVPKSVRPNNEPRNNLVPVEVVFFENDSGEQGITYNDFSVLLSTGLKGAEVGIIGVEQVSGNKFNITFNDYIPPELWGKTTIYINNNAVRKSIEVRFICQSR
jgi:hypothetical protein